MHVPVRLKRIDTPAAADAVLVAGADARALAAVARVAGPAGVYRVRDGYVIVLKTPASGALPGIRLRRAGGDFYLPADAAVLPALLPDELVGLTRTNGIVALPGQFLAFDPHAPLPPHAWLGTTVRRDEWHPFPARPVRPERLTTIERPSPPVTIEEVLGDGQPEDAKPLPAAGTGNGAGAPVPEDARPAAGSGITKVTAAATFGVGRFLTWLGGTLKSPRLTKLGGGLARKVVEWVPRLTEKIFGDQEAALREVLRQLQSGDVEAGLRRAPIAVPPDPEVPTRVDHGDRLANRDPRFSLRDLLGGGEATIWLRGGDVWAALADEYRRLAAEAVRRGDYRRAAYLHGFLLRDFRTAANVLMSGGHFREAALLYRDKLRDHAAAAAAFEKAGDIDEAVRLLDGLEMFEPAGDLLLRAGDVERAHDRFRRAAIALAAVHRYLAAGDLVRRKAGDRAGAVRYYQTGWDRRGAESVACAERLVDEHFLAADWAAADALFDRAESYLAPPSAAEAGRLFNYALTVGQDFLPPERREALADRTRLLFARHLKTAARRGRAGPVAADLFGRDAPWPGPVVRDATYAARQGDRRRPAASLPLDAPPVRLVDGTTVAVVAAHESRDLIVATTQAVVCWRAADGRVVPLYQGAGREVLGLSADPAGRMVFVLFAEGDRVYLTSYVANGANSFSRIAEHAVGSGEARRHRYYLHPAAHPRDGDVRVTLCAGATRMMFAGPLLRPRATGESRDTYLRLVGEHDVWDWDRRFLRWHGDPGSVTRWVVDWEPAIPEGSPLTVLAVDWVTPSPRVLQIAGTDHEGVVHWSKFDAHRSDGPADSKQTTSLAHPAGFLAACLERPGHVVAATATNELHWLRVGGKGFEPRTAPRTLPVPARIVALAARRAGDGVVAVLEDGSAVVVHRPAG